MSDGVHREKNPDGGLRIPRKLVELERVSDIRSLGTGGLELRSRIISTSKKLATTWQIAGGRPLIGFGEKGKRGNCSAATQF